MPRYLILMIMTGLLFAAAGCSQFQEEPASAEEEIHVLLLTVDALRPANMSCYGYHRPTTPSLDRFAREGAVFNCAVSSCAWTNPSLLSILTARLPTFHGVILRGDNIRKGIRTLPMVMKASGLQVPSLCYLNDIPNFFGMGFDPVPPDFYRGASGDKLKFWLQNRPAGPFFAWSHYRYIHLPYNPPEPYAGIFSSPTDCPETDLIEKIKNRAVIPADTVGRVRPEEKTCVTALYDGEVRQMDDYFGEVMAILEERGEAEKTLVIVTADHGEELFEHGMVGHASTSQRGTLYDEEIRIPLLIRFPARIRPGLKIDRMVRGIDIMPTILDLLRIAPPPDMQGRSLAPFLRGGTMPEVPAVCETTLGGYLATPETAARHMKCVRTEEWKLTVLFGEGEPVFSLFNLVRDPEERNNLYGRPGTPEDRLKKILIRHLQTIPARSKRFYSALEQQRRRGTDQPIHIMKPEENDVLRFEACEGTVEVSWDGTPNLIYRIDYDVGRDEFHLEGSFEAEGNQMIFGPYTKAFWQDLPAWNPFRFRVRYMDREEGAAPWLTFTIEE